MLELVIGGYLIAFAVLLITGARLGQTYGYRRIFLLGVGVFTLASLLRGLGLRGSAGRDESWDEISHRRTSR